MNGELETGAYKPEAAGSREVIVDVCETALLAALIAVSYTHLTLPTILRV